MGAVNPQAQAVNSLVEAANPHVLSMLSERGKAIFFPHQGILGQSAEAKGKRINATIGIALEDDGSPLRLKCLEEMVTLPPDQTFTYAPSFGDPDLRAIWKEMLVDKNPSLQGVSLSKPVVCNALTHALSICGYLFADSGDAIIAPDMYWGNYRLIFTNAFGAPISTYNTFKDGGYDVAALREAVLGTPVGKKLVLLNFPNNPTGYTCTEDEAAAISQTLLEAAEAGNDLVVMIDDAYFGLVFEDGIITESIFARLANAHERLLAVKVDGATKEDYVWGFRVGFITYGIKGATPELYKALEDKTAGAVRGNISNAPRVSQSLLRAAYSSPVYAQQKEEKYQTLKRRCLRVKANLQNHPEYADAFEPLPFNSGYFMCVKPIGADPEAVRKLLLEEYSTGVIATSGVIRLAFSATPYDLIDDLLANIYAAITKVQNASG